MTTMKRGSKKKQIDRTSDPIVSRPIIPAGYGVPKNNKGLLPWSHVSERMDQAKHYWICTVSLDGRPHSTPVDGLWVEDRLYFGGSPQTRWNRNLAANPRVCVHLENGIDVVILHGEAHELRAMDHSLAVRLSEASAKKYGYGPKPEEYEAGGVLEFRASVVLAWKQFPKDVTRWQFQIAE